MVNETTELIEHTRCVRMHYPRTKGVLCKKTKPSMMRTHAITQGHWVPYVTELEIINCVRMHYLKTKGVLCN